MANTAAEIKDKVYKYGGHEFRLLPNTIALLHRAAPVLIRYRKLEYMHTQDIDLSEVKKVQERIEEIKYAIEDCEAVEEAKRDIKRIKSLKKTLKAEQEAFIQDSGLQQGIALYNDCVALAMYELITDMNLMRPLMNDILTGEVEAGALDYTDPAIVDFIRDVVSDFFLVTQKSKNVLKPK